MTSQREIRAGSEQLDRDIRLLGEMLGDAIARLDGADAFELLEELRTTAMALRRGDGTAGRAQLARRMSALGADDLARVANSFTDLFHLINVAEEQQRIRVLRERDVAGISQAGTVAHACDELRRSGANADEVRALLERLLVMPVITAHPTEARRRAVLHHLGEISGLLDRLDDPRAGARRSEELHERLREAVTALTATAKSRRRHPTPLDEVDAGLRFFERTLLEATPAVYRALEDALATSWPGEVFEVPTFLRFGSWIGGDRDGNPFVTADVTRGALERHRAVALRHYRTDVTRLWRALSLSDARLGSSQAARRALSELPRVGGFGSGTPPRARAACRSGGGAVAREAVVRRGSARGRRRARPGATWTRERTSTICGCSIGPWRRWASPRSREAPARRAPPRRRVRLPPRVARPAPALGRPRARRRRAARARRPRRLPRARRGGARRAALGEVLGRDRSRRCATARPLAGGARAARHARGRRPRAPRARPARVRALRRQLHPRRLAICSRSCSSRAPPASRPASCARCRCSSSSRISSAPARSPTRLLDDRALRAPSSAASSR